MTNFECQKWKMGGGVKMHTFGAAWKKTLVLSNDKARFERQAVSLILQKLTQNIARF